jgi:hypothetical protein
MPRRRLGVATEFARMASGFKRCLIGFRQVTNPRLLRQTYQKSGSFPPPALPGFDSTTTLSDFRADRCHAAPLRPLPSSRADLSRLPDPLSRRAVPTTPMDRSGCICRLLPQTVLPSPFSGWVGVHDFNFEACSGFTRYGPSIRSLTQGEVCRRASIQPVTQPNRLPDYRPTDHCPGGTFTHEVIASFGKHRRSQSFRGDECVFPGEAEAPASTDSAIRALSFAWLPGVAGPPGLCNSQSTGGPAHDA